MKKLTFLQYLKDNSGLLAWSVIMILVMIYVCVDKEMTKNQIITFLLVLIFAFVGVLAIALKDYKKKRDDGFE